MLTREKAREPGVFAVSITPFDRAGNIDEALTRAHFQRLAAAGVGVYVGATFSGEGIRLDLDETRRLYQIAGEELAGKAPVRAMGIDPRSVKEMLSLSKLAIEAGLDAMQVYSILAPGATPAEIERYFCDVVSAIDYPVVISVHHADGYSVPPELVKRLIDRFDHIVGVNATHASPALVDLVGAEVAVHVVDRSDLLNHLALGGHGFLGPEVNLVPGLCARLVDAFTTGDLRALMSLHGELLRVGEIGTRHPSMTGMKAILNGFGLPGGQPRAPRLPLADEDAAQLINLLRPMELDDLNSVAL